MPVHSSCDLGKGIGIEQKSFVNEKLQKQKKNQEYSHILIFLPKPYICLTVVELLICPD